MVASAAGPNPSHQQKHQPLRSAVADSAGAVVVEASVVDAEGSATVVVAVGSAGEAEEGLVAIAGASEVATVVEVEVDSVEVS